jgi:rod shape-determining protein MreD
MRESIRSTQLLASITLLVFVLLSTVELPFLHWLNVKPLLAYIPLFYWSMARPRSLHPLFVFLTGVIIDVLLKQPFGLSALMFLVLHYIAKALRQRIERLSMLLMWTHFILWLLVTCVAMWLLGSLISGFLLPLQSLWIQWLITIPLYPLLHLFFDRLLALGQRKSL